jgi:hypothetical protein
VSLHLALARSSFCECVCSFCCCSFKTTGTVTHDESQFSLSYSTRSRFRIFTACWTDHNAYSLRAPFPHCYRSAGRLWPVDPCCAVVRRDSASLRLVSDRLCGLVVRVLGYRSGGPGSIPGTTRKKICSGSGTGSTQLREYN